MRPEMHIFVGSKTDWHEITGDLLRHEEYPTWFERLLLPQPQPQ